MGTYVRGLCDVLDMRYIGTSRSRGDGLISFDAGDSRQWLQLEDQLKASPIKAVIDLIAPNVSPVDRQDRIPPALFSYPERLIRFATQKGAHIVHVGTDLPNSKVDAYQSFKESTLRSFLAAGTGVSVIIAPRLIGVGLSHDFLAGSIIRAVLKDSPIFLEDPDDVRGFLSVRTASQEIIHAALDDPQDNRPSFRAEREYLSTKNFYSKVLSIHERLQHRGWGEMACSRKNFPDLNEWSRNCWDEVLESHGVRSKKIFKAHFYSLDEEIEAMFKHGKGG